VVLRGCRRGSIVGNYGGGTGFSFLFISPTGGVTPPANNAGVTMGAVVTECLNMVSMDMGMGMVFGVR
jgi:hypothetical protein